jgi:hypothetical protein
MTKKMHRMNHIDRRICIAPMMDDVESPEFSPPHQSPIEVVKSPMAGMCPRGPSSYTRYRKRACTADGTIDVRPALAIPGETLD